MYCEGRIKTPAWEGDFFGRLTPPPEDIIEMERVFFTFPSTNMFDEQSCCDLGFAEEDNLLLDLEFETICPREFDGQTSGPTLAELNDTRSRSPLINPEMKRLHQVAILTIADTDEEPMCTTASTTVGKTQSSSVLELQLRTQQSATVYHEQHQPRYNCNTATTVSRSEAIPIPNRDAKLAQSVCLSPPSPQDRKPLAENLFQKRKPFEDFYQTQSLPQQFIAPKYGASYMAQRDQEMPAALSYNSGLNSSRAQKQESETSASLEQVAAIHAAASSAYQPEHCEDSDEEDDDIDSEVDDVEDTDEYCPSQKEGKTPARRKGRKSESEDMVPNPSKLLSIGRELDRLNKIISSLKPINEVPQHSRGRSRREKNKLASRACRLKKKQQHEANKVKLQGLQNEQENLMFVINDMKNEIVNRAHYPRKPGSPLNEKFKNMAKKAFAQQIAGHTTEFVRDVLQGVARGSKIGGLIFPMPGET